MTSPLPDLLGPELDLVICGSAAGRASAQAGAYYAGPGNKFWRILHEVGLTPCRLAAREFASLLEHGIGLTDLAKVYSGGDAGLRAGDDDIAGLREKILHYRPAHLAFNGKRAAAAVLARAVGYGPQPETIGAARLVVLPSTAGAANGYWDPAPWHELGQVLGRRPNS